MITEFRGEYNFLSNFYKADVEFEGTIYPSVEHAFQAAKTKDKMLRDFVKSASTASEAKTRGRSVSLRNDWESVKFDIMYKIVLDKFIRNEHLGKKLVGTGDEELIEGNPWGGTPWAAAYAFSGDPVWGAKYRDGEWKGENHLGKILMKTREHLKYRIDVRKEVENA